MPYVRCPGCHHSVYSAVAHSWAADTCPLCAAPLSGASRIFAAEPGGRTLRRDFASTPGAIAEARHLVDGLYGELGREVHEKTVLLISELVTNSVLHSEAPGGMIELVVCVSPASVRVEVRDDGEGFDASVQREPRENGGHGLRLVEALSDRWGAATGEGARVRFEIDRAEEEGTG